MPLTFAAQPLCLTGSNSPAEAENLLLFYRVGRPGRVSRTDDPHGLRTNGAFLSLQLGSSRKFSKGISPHQGY